MFTSVLGHVPLSLSTVELSLGWHMNLDARLKVLRALANVLPVLPSLEALALDGYITMGLDEVMAALPRASSTFRSISVAMTSSTHRDHDAAALWKSWVSMVLAMPRSLSTLLLCLEDMQYPEKNFDVSDGMLLELITALPVVADALKLHLPWWTEEMAQAIPFAPTLRRMSFGHTSSTLAPFPLALVVYRLPKEIITFGIHNCIVGVLDLLTAPDDAFPQLKELVLHNIQAPDESEPDALTDDMNLVELLLAIFASDQLRILDLDGTKAVDEDAGWVDQLPRSVHSLTMRVHKLDNVGLVGALLEQYAGATAGRRVHHRKLRFLDCSWSCSKIREMIKAPGLDVADDQCAETLCLYS
ncbi:hypothetical protein GGF31_001813 [Allomyces arbusculus]|nr:hypothetical protein GGF31_001813 [Allomyces arbusculus]